MLAAPAVPVTIRNVQPIIEAKSVSKVYRAGKVDVPALTNVSFDVPPGEFVSIVGPSGSGKSTLFYILGGLTRATSGSVLIDGVDFAKLSDAERIYMSGLVGGLRSTEGLRETGVPILPASAPVSPTARLWIDGLLAGLFSRATPSTTTEEAKASMLQVSWA